MNHSDQQSPTDDEARRLSRALVRLFQSPFQVFGVHTLEKPLTIADAIHLGGLVLATLNAAPGRDWLKEQNRAFVTKVLELAYAPDAMEEFLIHRIEQRAEDPHLIHEAILQVEEQMSGAGAVIKFLKKVMKETLPKPRRGRPTEFNPTADPSRFLALSTRLKGICEQFLRLQEQFPNRSNKELLAFLGPEFPEEAALLRKREGYISQTMKEFDFRILKSIGSKVSRLADGVAGKELFGWSFTYAVQRAGGFRRAEGTEEEEE